MKTHLESKTIVGLIMILSIAVGCLIFNKLTSEMVEVLKWVGSSFLAMRAVANVAENLPSKKE